MRVDVVRTGTANLASVFAGLRRVGAEPSITEDAEVVRNSPRVVLPGVGAFGAAMAPLREHGLVAALRERIDENRPSLAICLGLQLLGQTSEESPGEQGLGVFSGGAERFPAGARVPHMGWNEVMPQVDSELIRPGFAYFANSYCLRRIPTGWTGATTVHDAPFVAALERGPVLACQFHPELSGAWGSDLLERWLNAPC